MVDGRPERYRFIDRIGPVLEEASSKGRRVLVFGEMVALLWAEGNALAALALEELWNDLGEQQRFLLLCAYPAGWFAGSSADPRLRDVCARHSEVVSAPPSSLC
jgi:hypothetical protein